VVNRRTEVIPGEGLTLRFGQLSAWIGPGASPALVAFVIGHARDLSSHPFPAPEIATRLEAVLRGSDPEPATPFVVVGAAPGGLEALLHGPVQLWDAAQWVVLPPGMGWIRSTFAGDGPVVAGPAGSMPPQLVVDSPIDLTTGVVPGGGLALLPVASPDPSSPGSHVADAPMESDLSSPAGLGTDAGTGAAAASPAPAMPGGGLSNQPSEATIVWSRGARSRRGSGCRNCGRWDCGRWGRSHAGHRDRAPPSGRASRSHPRNRASPASGRAAGTGVRWPRASCS
jgi:hypothetical protein